MTKQEADFIGSMNMCDEISNEAYKKIMCNCEVEEQQPCEDCISILNRIMEYTYGMLTTEKYGLQHLIKSMMDELSSVTPKFTDEEIQKMQDLEQAQLDKAYELGMQTSFEEWLSSFNTESAPQCFNAVQELKKQIEKKQNT